jgi:UrcA family protein
MKRNLIGATAGVLALGLFGTVALGQEPAEVTVVATRMVSAKVASTSPTGIPIVDVSLSYGVSTVGLDLASHEGANELEMRVKDAAAAACKEVGRQYPDATPSDAECTRLATKKAMVKVHQLVRAAGTAPAK